MAGATLAHEARAATDTPYLWVRRLWVGIIGLVFHGKDQQVVIPGDRSPREWCSLVPGGVFAPRDKEEDPLCV